MKRSIFCGAQEGPLTGDFLPGAAGLGRLPRKRWCWPWGARTLRGRSLRTEVPTPASALPGSLSLLQPGTKRSLLEPSISDVSMQDRDTKVWAEVEEGTGNYEEWGVGEVRASWGEPWRLSRKAISKEQDLAQGLAWA